MLNFVIQILYPFNVADHWVQTQKKLLFLNLFHFLLLIVCSVFDFHFTIYLQVLCLLLLDK